MGAGVKKACWSEASLCRERVGRLFVLAKDRQKNAQENKHSYKGYFKGAVRGHRKTRAPKARPLGVLVQAN